MATGRKKAVWKRPAPATAKHTALSPADKNKARAAAKRAGRPYPNLVDNLRVAKAKKS
jgi:hypothetical protein